MVAGAGGFSSKLAHTEGWQICEVVLEVTDLSSVSHEPFMGLLEGLYHMAAGFSQTKGSKKERTGRKPPCLLGAGLRSHTPSFL